MSYHLSPTFKKRIQLARLLNEGIRVHHLEFFLYRSIDGKVQQFPLALVSVNQYTDEFEVTYYLNSLHTDTAHEVATAQDLLMIQQRAADLYRKHLESKKG